MNKFDNIPQTFLQFHLWRAIYCFITWYLYPKYLVVSRIVYTSKRFDEAIRSITSLENDNYYLLESEVS